ncbi:hypothetical protein ACVWZA_001411 [Sphingomonas sp. UYAg733]
MSHPIVSHLRRGACGNSEDAILDGNLTVDETAPGNTDDNVIVDNATDTVVLNDTVANAN